MIQRSLEEVGAARSIVIDENNVILAGNGLVEAAGQVGITKLQVVDADGDTIIAVRRRNMTPEQKKRYAYQDNQTGATSEWDVEQMARDVQAGVDLEGIFYPEEIEALMADVLSEGGVPEPTDSPDYLLETCPKRCESGDLWRLGPHYLKCGDATFPQDVEHLLRGAVPNLMVTDPPYGVNYDPSWRNKRIKGESKTRTTHGIVTNDHLPSWRDAYALFPGNIVYVWRAGLQSFVVAEDLISCGFELRSEIIWVKKEFAISRGHYHFRHEGAWYAVRKGKNANWQGDHSQTTIWEMEGRQQTHIEDVTADGASGHSTQKPLEAMGKPIRHHTVAGDAVYDPFCGSGTSLLACENLGRIAYCMEISPEYCNLILARWELLTGQTAVKVEG
jgi:DNA modification methylase